MVLGIFAVTLFVSAFLLFLVQPMIGKLILPKLGGTPQVWNTCMVFFQTTLLAGYAYTHSTSTRLTVRRQLLIHCILLVIPLLILLPPIGPFDIESWIPPHGGNPIWSTLLLLLVIVGLPFFVVSTSAPLLQKWFVHTDDPAAKDPYFLYAASNFGSMLGLLAYPFFIEWLMPLHSQKWMWMIGYVFLIATVGVCAFLVWRSPRIDAPIAEPEMPPPETPAPPVEPKKEETAITTKPSVAKTSKRKKKRRGKAHEPMDAKRKPERSKVEERVPDDNITAARRIRWVLLAAAPSSLMLGLTTYISTDLSPFPLIWVIPLALYLLSFILVFLKSPVRWTGTPHQIAVWTQPIFIFAFLWVILNTAFDPFWASAITWLAFFSCALVCHGEMAKDRPSAKHLTEFYLWMSVGGMLGGVFNAIFAPLIFTEIVEFPLAIVLVCFLRPVIRKEGWIDSNFTASFPRFHQWAHTTGAKFAEFKSQTFLVCWSVAVFLWGVAIYTLMISAGWPTGLWVTALFVGAFFAMATLGLRYWPSRVHSMCLDVALPLVAVLLAVFLRYNADSNWYWNPNFRLDLNKLTAFLAQLKFVDIDQNQQAAARITRIVYGLLVFGIPMLFAVLYSSRPIRFGITVAGILLLNRYVYDRQPSVLYAGRSYFGVLRVLEDDESIRQFLEPRIPKGETPPQQLKPDLYLPNESALPTDPETNIPVVPVTQMRHGTTLHGLNFQDPQLSRLATTYYHRKGPVGEVMEKLNWFKGPQNTYWADNRLPASVVGAGAVGVGLVPLPVAPLVAAWSEPPFATIGLGTGTMASYGRPFQHVAFYEIDADVRNFSLPPGSTSKPVDYEKVVEQQTRFYKKSLKERTTYFTYVKEAIERGVRLEIIMGDARLSLDQEKARANRYGFENDKGMPGLYPKRQHYYRVMEIDAFSSDAIPVHLITKEAIELYFSKLAPDGVICVHTSNRHIELEQAVFDIAKSIGCSYLYASDQGPYPTYEQRVGVAKKGRFFRRENYLGFSGSTYVMLAHDLKYLVDTDRKVPAEELSGGESGASYKLPVDSVYVPTFDRKSSQLSSFELLSRFSWYGRDYVLRNQDGKVVLNARPSTSPPWTDDFSNIVMLLR